MSMKKTVSGLLHDRGRLVFSERIKVYYGASGELSVEIENTDNVASLHLAGFKAIAAFFTAHYCANHPQGAAIALDNLRETTWAALTKLGKVKADKPTGNDTSSNWPGW